MSILRIHKKQNNFVILDKTCLGDSHISWAARGLHAYLISMPDDWKVRVSDLQKRGPSGRDAVRGLLKELEEAGYIGKSLSRDVTTGRFGALEYLVYEIPEPKRDRETPSPENTSPGENYKNPGPEYPEAGNPSPANPTLINNKDTKYPEINNKAAAEMYVSLEEMELELPEENLAAAPFFEKKGNTANQTADIRPFRSVSPREPLIGEAMTSSQKDRIRMLAESLAGTDLFYSTTARQLEAEITFCMGSKGHFKACGRDFNYKLNAIKAVMLRGDWQTPAELLCEIVSREEQKENAIQQELNAAIAEARHFEKLMNSASTSARPGIAEILTKAKDKIATLQQVLQQTNFTRQA